MKVRVNLFKKTDLSYDIEIHESANMAELICSDNFGLKYCIITDSNLEKSLGKKLLDQFKKQGANAELVSFPSGEKNKNLKTVAGILEKMHEFGFDRRDCVVALGGGITGDIAGFVASIYMRGINFVQIPTTLLAMADSSIGGKTGVDLKSAKNYAGTFHQPKKVYISLDYLDSLPKKEISNGLSEVVKHAILSDKEFFSFLEQNADKLLARDRKTISFVVKKNCQVKAAVVEKDEKESNYRRIVNFGHTIGHALEVLGHYEKYSHGEAISIGMIVESEISEQLGLLKKEDVERIRALFKKLDLPIKVSGFGTERIIAETKKDKKAVSGKVYYSIPARLGKMYSVQDDYGILVDEKIVKIALGRCT